MKEVAYNAVVPSSELVPPQIDLGKIAGAASAAASSLGQVALIGSDFALTGSVVILSFVKDGFLGTVELVKQTLGYAMTKMKLLMNSVMYAFDVAYENRRGIFWFTSTAAVIAVAVNAAPVVGVGVMGKASWALAGTVGSIGAAGGTLYTLDRAVNGEGFPNLTGGLGVGMAILGIGYIISQTGIPDFNKKKKTKRQRIQ